MNNLTDPRSTQFAGAVPAAAAAAAVVPAAAAAAPQVLAAATGRGQGPAGFVPASGRTDLGTNEDTAAQTAALQASNAAMGGNGPSMSAIGPADYANRNAAFNEGAALRTAAAQGMWSPRRGYQGNDDAVRAAALPIAARNRAEEVATTTQSAQAIANTREAGDNSRAKLRDTGDTQRANIRATSEGAATYVAARKVALDESAHGFQSAAARQLQELQGKYLESKDPAEQATLARQIREYQGKDAPARFKVAAGGQQPDANGVPYKVPDRVFNEQTGQFADTAPPAANPSARPVGTKSTVNGKTAVWDGKQWQPQ
ncbi:MAG: hypothetical protein EOO24_17140 [Comamonadaceae bacterium]|nr:MAG: hypothetical protein EOO24_17140 [Comamonadaceae bacterium]